MDDPLAFTTLTGAALTQAFGFLYGRLGALLDRMRARREQGEPVLLDQFELPKILTSDIDLSKINDQVLSQKADQLKFLNQLLQKYASTGNLDGSDSELRAMLGRLRVTLEEIYGQRITFQGEARSGLRISTRAKDVHGDLTGLEGRSVSSKSNVSVIAEFETIHQSGKVTLARFETLE